LLQRPTARCGIQTAIFSSIVVALLSFAVALLSGFCVALPFKFETLLTKKKQIMKKLFLALAALMLAAISHQPANAHVSLDEQAAFEADLFGGAYLKFAGKHGGDVTKAEIAGTRSLTVDGCAHGSVIYRFDLLITKN